MPIDFICVASISKRISGLFGFPGQDWFGEARVRRKESQSRDEVN
jgi:hypothetical protein